MTPLTPVLKASTPPEWVHSVVGDFDRFLLDHASAERKASAMAVSFVVQYPDKPALHLPLIRMAREELLHFQQVTELMHERGVVFERDERDAYVAELRNALSTNRRKRLLDRLMMGAVIEARGVERFGLVAQAIDPPLRGFYRRLARSEQGHAELFPSLAAHYYSQPEIGECLEHWLGLEAQAMRSVPIRAALH